VFWYHSTRIAEASASCRYRIGNLVELLRGATAVIGTHIPRRSLRGKSVALVSRPMVDEARAATLANLRSQGLYLVADFDDLLFDCPIDEFPLIRQHRQPRAVYERRLQLYRSSLMHFDAFTVATVPLAQHLRKLCSASVHVVPNAISRIWLEQSRLLYRSWIPGDAKVIRYLSGSPTHDADFNSIAPALNAFLCANPTVRLEIVGHLRFDQSRFPAGCVSHRPHLPFQWLGEVLAPSWVNLAPLTATAFNRCKSAIKFLEAAALGCPTIATPVPDMERHASGGVLLATSRDDWFAALTELLDDEYRIALGQRIQAYVRSNCMGETAVAALHAAHTSWPRSCLA
jgi:glycosyltransferase involved in cell wall biosynthesis